MPGIVTGAVLETIENETGSIMVTTPPSEQDRPPRQSPVWEQKALPVTGLNPFPWIDSSELLFKFKGHKPEVSIHCSL